MTNRHQELIRLKIDSGGEVQMYLSQAAPQDWAVVYVHGFGSTRGGEKALALEAACARRGWTFISFDFCGHGESTGTLLDLRCSRLLVEFEALRVYLAGRGIHRLCPYGSSMGGWAAAWFALQNPQVVAAVAVVAPAFAFLRGFWVRLTDAERAEWKRIGRLHVKNQYIETDVGYGLAEEVDDYPMERLAAGWTKPLLIFHGMQDDLVPHSQTLAFVEKTNCPHIELRLYKDGDHRLLALKDEMAEAACEFYAHWLAID